MEKVKLSCELQGMVVHPTDRKYKDTEGKKLLMDLPIITHDITNTNYMFGPDLSGVREKKLRNKPSRVDTE